jgi:DnaJ family protein C protein 9
MILLPRNPSRLYLLHSTLNFFIDKAPEHLKDEATTKFQEVAFAYAVLSDPIRRKRYDTTGSTAESIDFEDFSWSEFYSEQFRDVISGDAIETFSKAYKGSDEEKDDLLNAYEDYKGKWDKIYEVVMLSNPLEDEDRYRTIIDAAIEKGDAKPYKAYTDETKKQKDNRMKQARKAGKEAEELAKKLGVHDKLFGGGKGEKKESGHDALAALIQKRQAGRENFFDHLEAKYAEPKKGRSKKRASEDVEEEEEEDGMPSEEAFQAAAARLKKGKKASEGGRQSKRVKH